MTEYVNFPKDFAIRTKDNLNKYIGNYEVTNLINCCLGLIIIPKEELGHTVPKYSFNNSDTKYGISKKNITKEINQNFTLKNTLRHIRNGLAHGRIKQKTEDGQIVGLKIYDKNGQNGPENFSIHFSVEEFKQFAINVSKLIEYI